MKRYILLWVILVLALACPSLAANKIWPATCLTGTSNCLDAIDGNSLSDGDGAIVVYEDTGTQKVYFYALDSTSGLSEAVPSVISPNSNAGTKRWILTKVVSADTYSDLVYKWASGACSGYLKSDGTCNSGDNLGTSTYSDIMALWGSCTGYLKSDGTCSTGGGGVGFDESGDYTLTGSWDFSGATMLGIFGSPPTAGTSGVPIINDTGLMSLVESSADCIFKGNTGGDGFACATPSAFWDTFNTTVFTGTVTTEQLLCGDTGGGVAKIKSCGAKVTDNSTASNMFYKDADGEVENLTLSGASLSGGTMTVRGIPTGTDPDIATAGYLSQDTDGANLTGDVSIRGYDGTNQFLVARKMHSIHVTVVKPQDLADAVRDKFIFWENDTGMTFTITRIGCWAGTDNTDLTIKEYNADGSNVQTVDAVSITTDGTTIYYAEETTITGATIEATHLLSIDFDDTDDPSYVKCTIRGWFDANVD